MEKVERVDKMSIDGLIVMLKRHREAKELVDHHLEDLRNCKGSLALYGAACIHEVSLRLMIEKLAAVPIDALRLRYSPNCHEYGPCEADWPMDGIAVYGLPYRVVADASKYA